MASTTRQSVGVARGQSVVRDIRNTKPLRMPRSRPRAKTPCQLSASTCELLGGQRRYAHRSTPRLPRPPRHAAHPTHLALGRPARRRIRAPRRTSAARPLTQRPGPTNTTDIHGTPSRSTRLRTHERNDRRPRPATATPRQRSDRRHSPTAITRNPHHRARNPHAHPLTHDPGRSYRCQVRRWVIPIGPAPHMIVVTCAGRCGSPGCARSARSVL